MNLNETLDENVGVGGLVMTTSSGLERRERIPGQATTLQSTGTGNGETGARVVTGYLPAVVQMATVQDVDDNGTNSDQMDTTADGTRVNGQFIHFNFQFQCTAEHQNNVP